MALLITLRDRIRRAAHYLRTVEELRNLPDAVARDLGIHRTDARRIARHAVFGA